MKIKEKVMGNIALYSHPEGLDKKIKNDILECNTFPKLTGVKNALIIGGSSGYGLATRMILSEVFGADTINVSFEGVPGGKKTGTAGYWNVLSFKKYSKGIKFDINGDAFSSEVKNEVLEYVKKSGKKIDLVVYSLAAGARKKGEDLVKSVLKPIGSEITGRTIDIGKNRVKEIKLQPGTDEEIENTIYVMGGSDWFDWINFLKKEDVLTKDVRTFSYTYIGSDTTKDIYRDGTIGRAKIDLEKASNRIRNLDINSFIVSSKAITTKASVFIPSLPIYAGVLYSKMIEKGTHESVNEHIYRLFKDMIFGEDEILDSKGRYRVDNYELEEDVQNEVTLLMESLGDKEVLDLEGTKKFVDEFYQINGFRIPGVDYEKDIDLCEFEKSFKDKWDINKVN